jgi:hypothetical protein
MYTRGFLFFLFFYVFNFKVSGRCVNDMVHLAWHVSSIFFLLEMMWFDDENVSLIIIKKLIKMLFDNDANLKE